MRWVQQDTGTHQLPSRMENLCCPLLPYPMTVWMHINISYFPGLWLHLHLSGIPLCLFLSSSFLPHLFPLSCLSPKFLTVTCPYLSSSLVSDVGWLPSSSVPPLYSYCICPSWIEAVNENGRPSGVFGSSLVLCGTITPRFKFYPRSPLPKTLLLVIIEALIVCSKGHENMVLYVTPYPRVRDNVAGFSFTTKGVL